jgi:hypothetical protein
MDNPLTPLLAGDGSDIIVYDLIWNLNFDI